MICAIVGPSATISFTQRQRAPLTIRPLVLPGLRGCSYAPELGGDRRPVVVTAARRCVPPSGDPSTSRGLWTAAHRQFGNRDADSIDAKIASQRGGASDV